MLKKTVVSTLFIFFAQAASAQSLEKVGDVFQFLVPVGVIATENPAHRATAVEGWVASAAATQGLKYLVNAPRPNGGDRGWPSGHTSSAAYGLGYSARINGWDDPTTLLAMLGTAVVGYSRVESDNHNWNQVAAGLALGTYMGYQYANRVREGGPMFTPFITGDGMGVNWNLEF